MARYCTEDDIDLWFRYFVDTTDPAHNTSTVNSTTIRFTVHVATRTEDTAVKDMTEYINGTTEITLGSHCDAISCSKTGSFSKDLLAEGFPMTGFSYETKSIEHVPQPIVYNYEKIIRQEIHVVLPMNANASMYTGSYKEAVELGWAFSVGIAKRASVSGESLYLPGCSVTSHAADNYDSRRVSGVSDGVNIFFTAHVASATMTVPPTISSLTEAFSLSFGEILGVNAATSQNAPPDVTTVYAWQIEQCPCGGEDTDYTIPIIVGSVCLSGCFLCIVLFFVYKCKTRSSDSLQAASLEDENVYSKKTNSPGRATSIEINDAYAKDNEVGIELSDVMEDMEVEI